MKNDIEAFWQRFCRERGKDPGYREAFMFGVEADWLADLVVTGKKTATCSGLAFYEMENEALPQAGEYDIVLDSREAPAAVIQVTSVDIVPMNEVSEAFALAEGEGDYDEWWRAHEAFFREELPAIGRSFSPDMRLVCERFTCVYQEDSTKETSSFVL
ncbi:ASCH domain-containing protein [Alkalicoccus chagannorensis]|uniref:ASCH domain-containing protein n=1 Tax=Alkalicoccus chagannorensis TaxID=427072 RepID=UPI000423C3B9|nr:ASCH domain-containing protein [Alkalicoccus chagannorensis]